jgi:hypothetical protein
MNELYTACKLNLHRAIIENDNEELTDVKVVRQLAEIQHVHRNELLLEQLQRKKQALRGSERSRGFNF